ncbi:pentatricopeptide repeat-containing protein [Pyrus ussuriensis x Pyrus communis]|uniref:Pentatricopeptide repeat-containing protein n=1 Tax=Pyrus ussuriensis x Pyrus communis TaxID=2448454 RepID=A0A5N5HK30_9ROSA|nr:pentatricopeptide repeat-containing protein [Pyrus ussuriensis x Pyrus communis]
MLLFFFLPTQSYGTPTPSNSTQKRLHSHAQIHRPIPSLPLSNAPVQHPPPLLLPNGVQSNQGQLQGALHRDLGSPRSAEIRRSRAFYEDTDDRSFEVAAESDEGLSDSRPVYQPERPREGFVTHGIFPSSFTFCSLIHSFSNEGDMSKAIEVLELMTDEKVKYPFDNFVSSSNAVDEVCKRGSDGGFPESACEVYLVMRRKGSVITSKTYYTILTGLIGGGKDSLTQSFSNIFLKEYGLEEPKVSRILAYDIYLKGVDDALRFLDKMKDKPATVTLPVTLFNTLIKNGRVLDAYKLVMVAGDGLSILDAFDYSLIVDGLCKVGYINEALDLCSFAKNKWVTLDIIIYNSVINGLCRQGHLVEAFRLFDSLERINLVPTDITYATSIDALRIEGFLLDAKQFFERMVLKGFKPNIHVYNSIIDGYCKIGDMNDALKVLYDLDLKSLQLDEFTVSIVINGFCLKGDMEGAIKFFVELKGKGTLPDFLGFLYLLRGLCAKGRMEEA